MIVVNCRVGQMSNRKIVMAHALARGCSRGEKVIDVRESFAWGIELKTIGWLWLRLVALWLRVSGAKNRDWEGVSRNRCLCFPGLMIIHGWTELRDFENLRKYQEDILSKIAEGGLDSNAKARLLAELEPGKRHIALHKRQGDYKTWKGGQYYFDDARYEAEARRYPDAQVIVFSSENPKHTAAEDQWLMSKCDLIVGPPSTFSRWASFMGGGVPIEEMRA